MMGFGEMEISTSKATGKSVDPVREVRPDIFARIVCDFA
jgi:hypothetical protein